MKLKKLTVVLASVVAAAAVAQTAAPSTYAYSTFRPTIAISIHDEIVPFDVLSFPGAGPTLCVSASVSENPRQMAQAMKLFDQPIDVYIGILTASRGVFTWVQVRRPDGSIANELRPGIAPNTSGLKVGSNFSLPQAGNGSACARFTSEDFGGLNTVFVWLAKGGSPISDPFAWIAVGMQPLLIY